MRLKRTVEPTTEPVSLAEAKAQCRVDSDDENTFITGLIQAAREYVEDTSHRALLTQTWRLSLDAWPACDEIELPRPPLQSVTSLVYYDSAGTLYTLDSSKYGVDTDSEPGRVVLNWGESWPSLTLRSFNPVQVTFKAGYGDDADDVPLHLRQAILLIIGHWFENRELTISGTIIKEIPLAVDSLIYLNRA